MNINWLPSPAWFVGRALIGGSRAMRRAMRSPGLLVMVGKGLFVGSLIVSSWGLIIRHLGFFGFAVYLFAMAAAAFAIGAMVTAPRRDRRRAEYEALPEAGQFEPSFEQILRAADVEIARRKALR